MADRIDVSALLASADIVSVVGSYFALKKVGAEFSACCPFHADKTPSFYVVPNKRLWHCFGCGEGGDVINFIEQIESVGFKEACEILGAPEREWKPSIVQRPTPPTVERVTSKPPPDAGMPNMAMRELGEPAAVRAFHDEDGWVIGYEARYDLGSNGTRSKQIRMWTWGRRGDGPEGFACGHFQKPRPLYNLHLLKQRPLDPVCITEGPKKADAGAVLLPQYVHVSIQGGAQGAKHVDFAPLAGRRLLLWPDADEVGRECMAGLARLLGDPRGLACDPVKLVDVSDWTDGRDLADCLAENWTPDQVMEWAGPRVKVYAAPQQNPEADQEPEQVTAGTLASAPPPDLAEGPPAEFPPEATEERPDEAATATLPVEMSEDALAFEFASRHEQAWRYVKAWHAWFEWLGSRWREDRVGALDRLAVEHCREATYWPGAVKLSDSAKRGLSTRRFWFAVRDTAGNDQRIRASVEQWDTNPLLLGVEGGVVDLRNGLLKPGMRDDYITKSCAVAPATGKPELWLAHLRRMTGNDQAKIDFLQLYAGYCATGETREQCFAFLFGPGQNGKGVFVTTLARVLGDYAVFANSSTFMDSDGAERHLSELARLHGARLVVVDETDSSKRWNEARVKSITGGGKITANRMRQDPFEFDPQFKLLIAGNHRPQIRGVGKAIRRRIKLVECLTEIPETERDNYFDEKLREEYPRILGWIIEGAQQWIQSGLTAPESIEDATERYIQSEDTIGEWLEDCCAQKDRLETGAGYRSYCDWCQARNDKAWTRRSWNNAMAEKGYDLMKSHGLRYLIGVSLRATDTAEQERRYYSPD